MSRNELVIKLGEASTAAQQHSQAIENIDRATANMKERRAQLLQNYKDAVAEVVDICNQIGACQDE